MSRIWSLDTWEKDATCPSFLQTWLQTRSAVRRLPPDFIKHRHLKNPWHGRSDGRDTETAWDNHRRRQAAEEPRKASDRRRFTVNQDYGAGSLSALNNLQRLQAESWWMSEPFFFQVHVQLVFFFFFFFFNETHVRDTLDFWFPQKLQRLSQKAPQEAVRGD